MVVVLSGGTGTPKLLRGLMEVLPPEEITVIVNTAEDIWVSGNLVCPDLDTVTYLAAGMLDEEKWWGIRGDTFQTHESLTKKGWHETLKIGDLDRGFHIIRSELLRNGKTLTTATSHICKLLNIKMKILPMTDAQLATWIKTPEGWMHFQEFWVQQKGEPQVTEVEIRGLKKASPQVIAALNQEKKVIIGPSNPITSIGPILGLQGIREILQKKKVIAISPIIGGKPVSGPAGKLMAACGIEVSTRGIANYYQDFLDVLIADSQETPQNFPCQVIYTDTIMSDPLKSRKLARLVTEL